MKDALLSFAGAVLFGLVVLIASACLAMAAVFACALLGVGFAH